MEKNEIFPDKNLPLFDESNSSIPLETQAAKINEWKNDPKIRMFLFNSFLKNYNSVLKLEVVSLENEDCELEENDIRAVFENFGKIIEVKIKEDGVAFIIFSDVLEAYFAQIYLNNREIEEDQIKLKVEWCSQSEIKENDIKLPQSRREIFEENKSVYNGNNLSFSNIKNDDLGVPSNNKLTCRYNIQIENDKDFQVARRIIGPKGCHMKRIIDSCIKEASKDITNTSDLIKLRLRGKGSGYKEGIDKQESQDPLHLCLSSAHQASFLYACKMVEEHLSNIYDEYKKYCNSHGRTFCQNLSFKKLECSNIKTLLETTKQPTNNDSNVHQNNSLGGLPKNVTTLEEELSKMHIEKNIIFNPENNNNHVDNNYFKDHQNLVMKKPTSEPFYPTLNKTNIPMTAFNDQSFYPNPINKGLLSNNNKNQKAVIPNNNMISPNIYNNFNPLAQNFASNFSTSLPLNNLYQNNTSINALLKELNITEEEIKKLIEDRNKARREQNFLEADRIRNFLKVKGIALMDEKGGRGKGTEVTTWKICKLNYNNVKTGDFYAYNNNGNAYNNEEGNNNIAFNGKFLKYNP